jgi:hypothetical protein
MEWYSRRGDASENRIKDLKIGALTYNLYLGFRSHALGHVRRDPRALRAHYVGRRRHPRDVVIRALSPSWETEP